jgi:VCBS repeat-containing protein
VLEAVTPAGNLTDTGTIAFTDVDLTDVHVINPTVVASSGALGVLTASVTTDTTGSGLGGVVTWNYSVAASAVEYLAKDQTKVQQFTITLDDGHGGTFDRIIEVTITGTNDAVAINAIAPLNLDEQTDTSLLTETIPVAFTDVDLTDVGHTADITHVAASGAMGSFAAVDDPVLITLMTTGLVNKASGFSSGSLDLDFTADSTVFDYLEDADVLTLTYTLEIDDLHGGLTTSTSVVHITGNDLVI